MADKNSSKVVISGYYGFNNFGDEAVLSVLIKSLKDIGIKDITVFSKNPELTSKLYEVKSIQTFAIFEVIKKILKSDFLISGGGSLLQDSTSKKSLLYYLFVIFTALFFWKKVIIFAQGIGPINDNFLKHITFFLLKRCKYISVRDEDSLNLLKENGISAELVSDPVWNIELKTKYSHRGVGIQLRKWDLMSETMFLDLAKNVAEIFYDKIIFIYALQESLDLDICNRFEEELLKINPDLHTHVITNRATFEIIKSFSHLDELIAMRYHACLIGLKYGIPVLPIVYDPKVKKLADEFEISSRLSVNEEKNMREKIEKLRNGDYKINTELLQNKNFNFENIKKILINNK